jgi:DNA-binding NarL/FixJ family response regulator
MSPLNPLNPCVLVVDDEFLIAEGLCLQIEDMGLMVCGTAASADEAVEMAVRHRPVVVLMDVRLAGARDGVDAALAIHDSVGSRVIFITGSREASTLARIACDHPAGLLFKPVSGGQLQSAIEIAMAN